MWELASAVALSIFLTVSLFVTVYGLAYLGLTLSIMAIKSIKKQLNIGDKHDT